MFRCIIIEDEPLAAKLLEKYISENSNLDYRGSFRNALEAQLHLSNNIIDLIFLDLNLPGVKGFEFLEKLEGKYFVILTTAYSEYALEGFEKGVIDYLLKPILYPRFKLAIDRLKDLVNSNTKEKKELTIQINKTKIKVLEHEITYIESNRGYVNIYDHNGHIYRTKIATQSIHSLLSEDFIRIHRSYIVNMKYVISYSATLVVLKDSQSLPIGRIYKDSTISELSHFFSNQFFIEK